MRRIREVLRLRHELKLSHRQISASTGMSKGSVHGYLQRAEEAGLTWEAARDLDDGAIEARLFHDTTGRNEPARRVPVDLPHVHAELRRTGVTLQLLWLEYREAASSSLPSGKPYSYSQFCDLYAGYRQRVDLTMRQVHRAGEKVFIDYSGKRPRLWDPATGEAIDVELFVAVLGASNLTYAEATRSQQLEDFCASTVRALEYFGGVPQIAVPDQLRSAISGPSRYDPDINPTYADLAQHYNIAIVPARPAKPRDKAKVETAVLVAQRWILARLRNRTFFSLDDLNAAIAALLEDLNTRPFRKLEGCRRSVFEAIDRPALQPLPARRWELARWKKATVNIDYHVDYDGRYYSVGQWKRQVSTTKTGVVRSVPLVPELAGTLRDHRAQLMARQHPGFAQGWVFSEDDGSLLRKNYLRLPLERVVKWVGIKRRFTVHGFRRTFNNIARQVAGEIVTRSITGHVTQAMTEHYSHVGREEKLAAAGSVVRLVFAGKNRAGGGSSGGSPDPSDPTNQR